jgi:pilus assembly protein Flp/PilA
MRKEVNIMLFSPREKGQGMVEYALIIVLIAIVVIVVLTVLGTQISTVFSQISSALAT